MDVRSPTLSDAADRVLGDWLREEATADPDRPFVQCDSGWISLAELDHRSDSMAAALQGLGVGVGDRVAVILPNSIEYIVLVYAIAKAGAVQVPVNTYLRGEFLLHPLLESGAVLAVCDGEAMHQVVPLAPKLPALKNLVLVDGASPDAATTLSQHRFETLQGSGRILVRPALTPDDLCVIMYTSGTTGASKGCVISHGYYCSIPATFVSHGWFRPGDRIFGASPLFHFTGQVSIVANALAARGSAVLEPHFRATTFMARAREVEATVVFGVGAMAMAILAQPPAAWDCGHGIRQSTWIPMTESDQERFTERFGIPVLSEVYGQSECWPVTLSHAHDSNRRRSGLGRALEHLEVRLVGEDDNDVPVGHVGEILVRAKIPNRMFGGYWNNPTATAETAHDGWHHTGDNGRFDDDGHLYFVDRKKDCLRRRGENVSSMELERAILAHPAVAAVAVHAVPSELGEDDIKACIVLMPEHVAEIDEMFAFFKTTLPYYAIPRYVEFLDELPVNQTLRIQKHLLRERGITETTIDLHASGLVVERHERRGR
ncbi:ATP-dependent acyl-CoA ligase [Mycobacterium paraintracellulare]|uniref:AMP-binding protein n=1 Tax=Mycobacterium paraintracellulare TaxID=1138383 RepID=UPI00192855B7|nr:AMP-binding protein [Mycobacterium paraintracellulare]BCO39211.1 ATP-dependent acyl-CoA ligase [Mycobacterium paraintracellulare]